MHNSVPLMMFFMAAGGDFKYGLGYAGHLCAALKEAGMATLSIEYRRNWAPQAAVDRSQHSWRFR